MKPFFHPSLVNEPFGDPGLYIDFLFERRALLFDIGTITSLSSRKLLRLSDVFVSHTHVDHFIGFDHLVRICLGRDMTIRFYGPPGFVDRVGHRLAGYTWNLVRNYPTDFTVIATEVHPDGTGFSAEFHCREAFRREGEREFRFENGVLLEDDSFLIRTAFLDHKIVSLGFALEEKNHVNIMKNRLDDLGLPVGPWLTELKQAVQRGAEDTEIIEVWRREAGQRIVERRISIGELKAHALRIVPGQKIAYVTDVRNSSENRTKIIELAKGADYFFIEAMFLHEEAARAAEKCHLTARQAGELGRQARADRVIPIHFSAKHLGDEARLRMELEQAFMGE